MRRYEEERLRTTWKYFQAPPEHAQNELILAWWSADHDEYLRGLIVEHGWAWQAHVNQDSIEDLDPRSFQQWEKEDPLCKEFVPYGVMNRFITARVPGIGLDELLPEPWTSVCEGCGFKFDSRSLEPKLMDLSYGRICNVCLYRAFVSDGDHHVSIEAICGWIRDLVSTLERVPPQAIISNPKALLPPEDDLDRRVRTLALVGQKPAVVRVRELFGGWLQALTAAEVIDEAGLRTSRGTRCLAEDGHVCASYGEKTIDDLLHRNSIEHSREPRYPGTNYRADFQIADRFVEYLGLAGNPEYDEKTRLKRKIAKENGITLIEILPKDLVSPGRLLNRLRPK